MLDDQSGLLEGLCFEQAWRREGTDWDVDAGEGGCGQVLQ